jgi:hypothetical protein
MESAGIVMTPCVQQHSNTGSSSRRRADQPDIHELALTHHYEISPAALT